MREGKPEAQREQPKTKGPSPNGPLGVAEKCGKKPDHPGHHRTVQVARRQVLGIIPVVGLFLNQLRNAQVSQPQKQGIDPNPEGQNTPAKFGLRAIIRTWKDKKGAAQIIDPGRRCRWPPACPFAAANPPFGSMRPAHRPAEKAPKRQPA